MGVKACLAKKLKQGSKKLKDMLFGIARSISEQKTCRKIEIMHLSNFRSQKNEK
jgi:hypothetical protein